MTPGDVDGASFHVSFAALAGWALTAAFGLWVWVLRTFGQQHVDTVKELTHKVSQLDARHSAMEARQELMLAEIQRLSANCRAGGACHVEHHR